MALFNFIYSNNALVSSLYSQIFSGLVKSIEHHEGSKTRELGTVEGGLPALIKGVVSGEEVNEKFKKEVVDPHDAALSDVLIALKPKMKNSMMGCSFGDIVHLRGRLFAIPTDIEKNAVDILIQMFGPSLKCEGMDKKQKTLMLDFVRNFLISKDDGMRFFYECDDGCHARGMLEIDGLRESQRSIVFKYANSSIPVEMVAIYEQPSECGSSLSDKSIIGAMHTLCGKANDLYTQELPNSYPVSPITLFYRINETEDMAI